MRFPYICLATCLLSLHASARQPPTSFCKCICFQNSTIIPLNAPPLQSGSEADTQAASIAAATATSTARQHYDSLHTDDTAIRREDEKSVEGDGERKYRELTCNDCNRAFCIDSVCKDAKEEDVFTSCFQRDSLKDETVVLLFIILTTSLLAWAILKPYVDKFKDSSSLAAYVPISSRGASRRNPHSNELPVAGSIGRYASSSQDDHMDTNGVGDLSHYGRLNR